MSACFVNMQILVEFILTHCFLSLIFSVSSFGPAKTSYTREAKGSLTFRLRIEYFDERKLVLRNLEPPPSELSYWHEPG